MSNVSDFRISKTGILTKYTGTEQTVIIPDGVTEIGNAAFYNNHYLKWVQFPIGIVKIGAQAFEDCKKLEEIVLPDGLTCIGSSAFRGCSNLKKVLFPESVMTIEPLAFYGCTQLPSVSLPDSLVQLGMDAFGGVSNLVDNKGFLIINKYLVNYRGNNSHAKVPEGITTICEGAFFHEKNDKIERITIPETVTYIGVDAFKSCKGLKSIVLPNRVTCIESGTFSRCSNLERVDIPQSVTSIKQDAFDASSQKLQISISDITLLPPKFRLNAAVCFANDGGDVTDPRYESYSKYFIANSGKIIESAVQNLPLLTLLCREGWIKAKDIESYVVAVQKTSDPERISLILDYQNNKITKRKKDNATRRKEKQENTVLDRAVERINQVGISEMNFVVTGNLNTFGNRNELKSFIESKGGKLQTAMSSKTDYLIMNESNSDTEKKKKAEALGIEIITEYQFNDLADRQFVVDENDNLVSYIGAATDISVKNGILGLMDDAFYNNTTIEVIKLPYSLRLINSFAIAHCKNLRDIFLASAETKIERAAIIGCPKITIHAPAGSYAENYAKEENIAFEAI